MASGFSHSAHAAEIPVASRAKTTTGATTIRLETPPDRIAIISLSADILPRPTRMPTSTPKGMLSSSTGGNTRTHSSRNARPFAERTSISNSLLLRCRNMTKVASVVARTELVRISRKTYRLRIFISRWRRDPWNAPRTVYWRRALRALRSAAREPREAWEVRRPSSSIPDRQSAEKAPPPILPLYWSPRREERRELRFQGNSEYLHRCPLPECL